MVQDCAAAGAARFLELGAVAVIARPFDPMHLGNQVLAIWEALPP